MSGPSFELNNIIVRAGAGAGKTHGLIQQVLNVYREYLKHHERPPRIVLTTFTRKATQELKERLILHACESRDGRLLSFVSDPSKLQIATMHGLMNSFLKRMGHLAGIDAGFQVLSESEAWQMSRLALREVLLEIPESLKWLEVYRFDRLLQMLIRYDLARREHPDLHPAGLSEIKAVVQKNADRWQTQIKSWADWIVSSTVDEKWCEFAEKLEVFIDHWRLTGYVDMEMFPRKPSRNAKRPEFLPLHDGLERPIKKFKDAMEKPGQDPLLWDLFAQEWSEFETIAAEFYLRMQRLKSSQARFEMADLELKALEILRQQPLLGEIFGAEWDYWMVDEFQDTSPLQVEILSGLIGARPRYIVGDPQQSIYLFRGAEVGVFSDAVKATESSGGEVRELLRNYRSAPELLAWINEFIVSLDGEFLPMEPRSDTQGSSQFQGLPRVLMVRATDAEAEGLSLVSQVGRLVASGVKLEEICVLGRTRRGLMSISRVLRSYGYPTHLHTSSGFASRREVLDAHALWKFLINPHDNLNLLILLRSPWFLVHDWQIADWMKDRPKSLWARLVALAHKSELPEAIHRLCSAKDQVDKKGLASTFESVLVKEGWIDLSLQNDPAGVKESNIWKLIVRAREFERKGGRSPLSLLEAEVSENLESSEGDAASAQEPNAVNLMTIHGSKGLQFGHVLIAGMGERPNSSNTEVLQSSRGNFHFPIWNEGLGEFVSSPLDQVHVEETRERESQEYDRWLYVALTRAKETLTLVWSDVDPGSWADRSPWFQRGLGEEIVQGCSVEVVNQMPAPQAYFSSGAEAYSIRGPFISQWDEGVARQSVTDLIDQDEEANPENRMGTGILMRRWKAQSLGNRIHAALEAIKYGGLVESDDDTAKSVRFVLELADPPLKDWIENGHVEWGFQVLSQKGLIEGQIDLWVKSDGKLYIVDYKSGSIKHLEQAFRQLSVYAWALRKFGHYEPAELLVIYPQTGKVERRQVSVELLNSIELELGRT